MTVKEFYELAKEKNMENAIMLTYECSCWSECDVYFDEEVNEVEIN